jgi:hypothetical protein
MRVSDSVSASAARSASVKYGASRHAATVNSRSSVSPACFMKRACMSTHTLQPLIWLARSCTRPIVFAGTPPFSAVFPSACSAFMASGIRTAILLIRACIVPPSSRHISPVSFVRGMTDGRGET